MSLCFSFITNITGSFVSILMFYILLLQLYSTGLKKLADITRNLKTSGVRLITKLLYSKMTHLSIP